MAADGEGRFSYSEISSYLQSGTYPENYTKPEKLALRKRSKYFEVHGVDDAKLYYVGGGKLHVK